MGMNSVKKARIQKGPPAMEKRRVWDEDSQRFEHAYDLTSLTIYHRIHAVSLIATSRGSVTALLNRTDIDHPMASIAANGNWSIARNIYSLW